VETKTFNLVDRKIEVRIYPGYQNRVCILETQGANTLTRVLDLRGEFPYLAIDEYTRSVPC